MCPSIDNFDNLDQFIEALEKPFWEPIGQYVFRFGMLERRVDIALSSLTGMDYFRVGMFVFSPTDFLARAHLLRVLTRGYAVADEMKKTVLDVEAQNTFRNNLVHGPWTAHFSNHPEGKDSWQKTGLSRRFNLQGFTITCDEIRSNAAIVDSLGSAVMSLSQLAAKERTERAAEVEPPPSPDKS
jgi:hypothetical protein